MKRKIKLLQALLLLGFSSSVLASPWPQSVPDYAAVVSGQSVTVWVLANDVGEQLVLQTSNDWSKKGGRTSIVGSSIKYTPPANFSGNDEFWYSFADYQGRTNSAKVTVAVSSSEYSGWPQSSPDYAKAESGQQVTIWVLANDVGDQLVLKTSNDWSKNGGRTAIVGSSIQYTPPANFSGNDEFWYSFADSQGRTNSAKVTVAVSEDEYSGWPQSSPDYAESDGQPITIAVLSNDNGKQLQLKSSNDWTQMGGRTLIVGSSVSYTPPASFSGTDTFWYNFTDFQGRANSAQVTVKVTAGEYSGWPQSSPDFATSTNGQSVNIAVLANDQGKELTLTGVNDWTENGGRAAVVGDSIQYTPPANFSGTDAFWYNFADFQNRANSAKVSVEVTANAGNSVIEFCGNTYESNGTKEGTWLTNLSAQPPVEPPSQPEVVDGVINVDGRIYSINDTASPQVLRMQWGNQTTNIVTASTSEPIGIIGGYDGKVYFLIDNKVLYSHDGAALTKMTDSVAEMILSTQNPETTSEGWQVTGVESVESASDDFYFAITGAQTRTTDKSVWRIDSLSGEPVFVGRSFEWSLGSNAGSSSIISPYYFNGLDYYGVDSYTSGISGGSSGTVHQRTGVRETNTLYAGLETFIEDRGRLFISTEAVLAHPIVYRLEVPAKLYVVGNDNEFIELLSCP